MEITRIFDLLGNLENEYPDKPNIFRSKENGAWVDYSVKQYREYADLFSYGLIKMGFEIGDKIATVSNNRPEWNFADMGMCQAGVIHVPIYPTISEEEFLHILHHSDAKLLIVSDESLYKKLKPIIGKVPSIIDILTFNMVEGARHWSEIVELGRNFQSEDYKAQLQSRRDSIKEDDILTIIYTSGTTGLSKGVMLSHKNFIYQAKILKPVVQVDHRHTSLSFLPLCHVLERVVSYTFQYLGMSIVYAENMAKIAENVAEIKPHCFVTVPRLLERVYDKIIAKGRDLKGIKRILFFWAVNLGLQYDFTGKSWWYKLQLKIANAIIFKKWREALGGNLLLVVSGGAALQPRLCRVFQAAGIPVQEGYGLTESAPLISLNLQKHPNIRIGSVGIKTGVEQEIKIADDGEILFKGPNLMLGYYKDPEKTKETIDEEGWLHTGDIGLIEDTKFLKITDRKKEIFKLSTGKYIAPQVIENILKESQFIEQAMVVGENEKFACALLVPNFEFLLSWAKHKEISFENTVDLLNNKKIELRFRDEINLLNKRLGESDKIKRFKILKEEFTIDGGELSPTLKLKRKAVIDKYKTIVDEFYKKSGDGEE